jgi:hypothetical protein
MRSASLRFELLLRFCFSGFLSGIIWDEEDIADSSGGMAVGPTWGALCSTVARSVSYANARDSPNADTASLSVILSIQLSFVDVMKKMIKVGRYK